MEYRVKHMETGEEMTLSISEVNDMIYGDEGQIFVFDTKMKTYLFVDDEIC